MTKRARFVPGRSRVTAVSIASRGWSRSTQKLKPRSLMGTDGDSGSERTLPLIVILLGGVPSWARHNGNICRNSTTTGRNRKNIGRLWTVNSKQLKWFEIYKMSVKRVYDIRYFWDVLNTYVQIDYHQLDSCIILFVLFIICHHEALKISNQTIVF